MAARGLARAAQAGTGSPDEFTSVLRFAASELGVLRSAQAMLAFEAAWQPVLGRLTRRSAALAGALAYAGGAYGGVEDELIRFAGATVGPGPSVV